MDEDDFDQFYRASRDRVAMQIAALTGDPIEALDHVQEAFVKAWARWSRVRALDDPEGWVRRVAYNHAVSRFRSARRLVTHTNENGDRRIEFDDAQVEIVEALGALSQREREAIVLHYLVGMSVDDVAIELSVPSGTVKSWLSRGRKRLANELVVKEVPNG